MQKSKINLMCFDNAQQQKSNTNIKSVISKLNVSLLLTGQQSKMLHK